MNAVHKVWRPTTAVLAIAGLFFGVSGSWQLTLGVAPSTMQGETVNAPSAAQARHAGYSIVYDFNGGYSTGFDSTETFPFALGPIFGPSGTDGVGQPFGQPDPTLIWGKSTGNFSSIVGEVSNLNPASGDQHFRIRYDATQPTGGPFGSVTDARLQNNTQATANPALPIGTTTWDFDIAFKNIGADIRMIAQELNGAQSTCWQMSINSSDFGAVMHARNQAGVGSTTSNSVPKYFLPFQDGRYMHVKIVADECLTCPTMNTKYYLDDHLSHCTPVCGGTGVTNAGTLCPNQNECTGTMPAGLGCGQGIVCTVDADCAATPGATCVAPKLFKFAERNWVAGNRTVGYDQFVIRSNNGTGTEFDLDNLNVVRTPCAPPICGNGTFECGETCGDNDRAGNPLPACNAGHTCIPAGQPGACTCSRICTLAEPCELQNGANGPYLGPYDALFGAIFLYDGGTQQAVAVDTCGTGGNHETGVLFWGSAGPGVCSDDGSPCGFTANPDLECGMGQCPDALIPCDDDFDCPGATELCVFPNTCEFDPGNNNDDCCNDFVAQPWCVGSTENASCFDPLDEDTTAFSACTCYDIPDAYDPLWLLQLRTAGNNVPLVVNINKKTTCGGDVLGSCCDSNGADFGCVDGVLASACTEADETWSNAKCADVTCDCIPDCAGRVCGPDGCPDGSCGTCDDSVDCTVDTCDGTGQCVYTPNSALCDDGVFCNGPELCSLAGCNPPIAPCASDEVCLELEDLCMPFGACCVYSDTTIVGKTCTEELLRDCTAAGGTLYRGQVCGEVAACTNAIPTVSEWGIAIMSLLLLVGLKVYFGRREAVA